MAALACRFSRHFNSFERIPLIGFLTPRDVVINSARNSGFFRHLGKETEHKDNYEYEVTNNLNEWSYVECLMPLKTIPKPTPKTSYPSGWRPMKEESLKLPYFVERSKNHMLSVYLKIYDRGQLKVTKVTKIHGNIWELHNKLKEHIEKQLGKKIASFVHEGNNAIHFKGDFVYYVEQWLLNKGF